MTTRRQILAGSIVSRRITNAERARRDDLHDNTFESSIIRDALDERDDVALHPAIFDFQEAPDQRVILNRFRKLV
jgi:hypothetical protein